MREDTEEQAVKLEANQSVGFWKPRRGKKHFKGDAGNRLSEIRVKTDHRIQKIALLYTAFLVIGLRENGKREMEKVRGVFNRQILSKSFAVKEIREMGSI